MNLTWHIVKKDLRCLKWPLALWTLLIVGKLGIGVALVLADGSEDAQWFMTLNILARILASLECVSFVLAAALIQEDLLVGTTAFWVTRPISGARLMRAKFLSIGLIFGVLPLLVTLPWWLWCGYGLREVSWAAVETVLIHASCVLIGLLWAVVTDGFARFLLWTLVLLFAVPLVAATVSTYSARWHPGLSLGLVSTRIGLELAIAVAGILTVVIHQFLTRRTGRSIAVIGTTACLMVAVGLWWPWDWNLLGRWKDYLYREAQRGWIDSPEPAGLTFVFEKAQVIPNTGNRPDQRFRGIIKFSVRGMPGDQGLAASTGAPQLHWPDGSTEPLGGYWVNSSSLQNMHFRNALGRPARADDEPQFFSATVFFPPAVVARMQSEPPELRMKVHMRTMQFESATTVPLQPGGRVVSGARSERVAQVGRNDHHLVVTTVTSLPDYWLNDVYGYLKSHSPNYSRYLIANRERGEVNSGSAGSASQAMVATVAIVRKESAYSAPKSVGPDKQAQADWLKNAELVKENYTHLGYFSHELRIEQFKPDLAGSP